MNIARKLLMALLATSLASCAAMDSEMPEEDCDRCDVATQVEHHTMEFSCYAWRVDTRVRCEFSGGPYRYGSEVEDNMQIAFSASGNAESSPQQFQPFENTAGHFAIYDLKELNWDPTSEMAIRLEMNNFHTEGVTAKYKIKGTLDEFLDPFHLSTEMRQFNFSLEPNTTATELTIEYVKGDKDQDYGLSLESAPTIVSVAASATPTTHKLLLISDDKLSKRMITKVNARELETPIELLEQAHFFVGETSVREATADELGF